MPRDAEPCGLGHRIDIVNPSFEAEKARHNLISTLAMINQVEKEQQQNPKAQQRAQRSLGSRTKSAYVWIRVSADVFIQYLKGFKTHGSDETVHGLVTRQGSSCAQPKHCLFICTPKTLAAPQLVCPIDLFI